MLKTYSKHKKLVSEIQNMYLLHSDIATDYIEMAMGIEAGTIRPENMSLPECWESFHIHNVVATVLGSILENNDFEVPESWGHRAKTLKEAGPSDIVLDKFI